jgi:hypothetical protein
MSGDYHLSSARALVRGGSGQAHWATFDKENQQAVVTHAGEIYQNLFRPILEYPIRTLALPAAGQALTADSLDLVFNLVNYVNSITDASTKNNPSRWRIKLSGGKDEADLVDDKTGEQTVKFLRTVKDWTERVFGKSAGSLALHPGVYCYGATGRFQPTAFFAAITLVQFLNTHRKFDKFTEVRNKFEEFILAHRFFINQIVGSYGSQLKGLPALSRMYQILLDSLPNKESSEIVAAIQADPELSFVREISEEDRKYGRNFSRETQSAIYLREALAKELTCGICGARIHSKMITLDHKLRKQDGGMGSPDNGQLAHPYCNDGYKEKAVHAKTP